jgi:integrase
LDGAVSSRQQEFDELSTSAEARGFSYKTAVELSEAPINEIMLRFRALKASGDGPGSQAARSLLGAMARPQLSLMDVAHSMAEWFPLEIRDKNERQLKGWRARWTRPAQKFVQEIGLDPVFMDIQRHEGIALRDSLQDAILDGVLKGSSAQKDIQNLDLMWKKYHLHLGFDVRDIPSSPFYGLGQSLTRLDDDGRKKEIPLEWLTGKILAKGGIEDIDLVLRDIFYILMETGCRQAEITDIPSTSIVLDHEIPHVWVRHEKGAEAREIKNKASTRKVPLVGRALEAAKRNPGGFPKYRGTGTLSTDINRELRKRGLLPEGVTVGGLRHLFETRLKLAGIDTDDRGELMGHSVKRIRGREHYGDMLSLAQKLDKHGKIVLP